MAKLTTSERNDLPAGQFAGPDRSYPIPDRSHAVDAKARASQAVNAGRMSPGQEASIDRKADAKIGGGSGPRQHSLSMASATHLHKAGYISSAHHAAIQADAKKRLSVHKASKAPAYGSLAPQSAGHSMATEQRMGQDQDQDQDGY